jgi:hypothetical protein
MLRPILTILAATTVLAAPAHAGPTGHAALLASVTSYKPMQGFNQIVGDKRFVGYFLAEGGACSVTVFTALADDERLVVAPQRASFTIKAADRAELSAGHGDALGIACTVDADRIVLAPLTQPQLKAVMN